MRKLCSYCREYFDPRNACTSRVCHRCSKFGIDQNAVREWPHKGLSRVSWPFEQVLRDTEDLAESLHVECRLEVSDLMVQWIEQKRRCHFTKTPLSFVELIRRSRHGRDPLHENRDEPVLYRPDPYRGFVRSNIVWVVERAFSTVEFVQARLKAVVARPESSGQAS